MGLRVRLTRSTMAALYCLMTTLLTFLGPSQVFAVQGNDGGRQPTGHQRAVESASRSSASHVQHLHPLPAPQAHPLPLQAAHGAQAAALQATYGRLPLNFELNDGQTNGQVKALARGAGYTLFLTNAGATLALVKRQAPSTQTGLSPRLTQPHRQSLPFNRLGDLLGQNNHDKVTESAVRLTFVGANPHPQVVGLDKLPGVSNYFIGNDRRKWRTNVAHYAKIEYKNVYPGVNLIYYGNQQQLEYDWVVEPGANAAAVRLTVQRWGRGADGSSGTRLDRRGNLLIHTASGDIVQGTPMVYQDVAGRRRVVNARYTLMGADRVGFAVGAYDTSKPLVIDPVLFYSTYFGGISDDYGYGIAVDQAGAAYVTGYTGYVIPTANALQPAYGGGYDAFVTKLNPSGSALVYSTYLGGNGDDYGYGIAVDQAGAAYVTGYTSSANFPTANALQPAYGNGNDDAFVVKLNPSGSALVYSTYLGGTSDDYGYGIAVDQAGAAYVTGHTRSTNFPTANALQPASGGGDDAFVVKLNPSGSALVYSTYLGGSGYDEGTGIAVDQAGAAYVTGATSSANFPTANALQPANGGYADAFVVKLNPSGSALVYSTYLGGIAQEEGHGIAVDQGSNAYVAGQTQSIDFPTINALQPTLGSTSSSNFDAFVAKIGSYNGPGRAEIRSLSEKNTTCSLAQTVSCATGDFWHTVTDLAIPGRGIPLNFTRTYNSVIANQNGPLGYGWTDNYNMFLTQDISGNVGVNEEGGATVVFSQTAPGVYQALSRVLATLVKNGDGTLTFARQDQEQFVFTVPTTTTTGQLVKEVDRNRYATALSYANGLLSTVIDPAGRQLNFAYYTTAPYSSCISAITDPAGRGVNFFYDASGNLATAFDVNGGHTSFTYYPGTHLLQTMTDPNGDVLTNTYDPNGRVIAQSDALNRTTAFSYTTGSADTQTTITDPNGNVTVENYENNVLLSYAKGFGTSHAATWRYTRDPATLAVTAATDPNGHTTRNTYDAWSNLTSHTDALGRTTSYAYDALNDTTAITDPRGIVTAMTYDAHGNLLSVSRPVSPPSRVTGMSGRVAPLSPSRVAGAPMRLAASRMGLGATRLTFKAMSRLTSKRPRVSLPTTSGAFSLRLLPTHTNTFQGTKDLSRRHTLSAASGTRNSRRDPSTVLARVNAAVRSKAIGMGGTLATRPMVMSPMSWNSQGSGVSATLYGVACPSTSVCYTVGVSGTILATTNGGGAWANQSNPLGGTSKALRGIACPSTTTCYAVGDGGAILGTTNGGSSWSTQATTVTTTLYSVACRSTSNCIAIGDNGVILNTSNGGGAWTNSGTSTNAWRAVACDPAGLCQITDGSLYGITCPAANTCFRTGYSGAISATTNGSTWTSQTSGTSASLYGISCTSASACTAVGSGGTIVGTTNGGAAWSGQTSGVTTALYGVTCPGASTCIAVGANGVILASSGGVAGTPSPTATPAPSPTATSTPPPGGCPAASASLAVVCLTYDPAHNGDVAARTDPDGHTAHYAYDGYGNLISSSDPLNNTTTYQYDSIGRMTSKVSPDGHVAGADPSRYTTAMAYDAFGQTTAITDPLGHVTAYQYDPVGNLQAITDTNGHATSYGYDLDNELTSVTRPDHRVLQTGYDAAGNVITRTDALSRAATFAYDSLNRVITATDPLGRQTTYGYDLAGNRTVVTDPLGRVTHYGYDQADQPTNLTRPDGTVLHTSYDAGGEAITRTTGLGYATSYTYDSLNRLIATTDPLSRTTQFGYDLAGHRTSVTDPLGRTTAYAYDAAGHLTATTRPDNAMLSTSYDAAGNPVAQTDPRGYTATAQYDPLGRLVAATDPLSHTTSYQYDPVGNRTLTTDPLGHSTADAYDAMDRLVATTDPLSQTTRYGYDAMGNRTTVTDPLTHTTSYGYDGDNEQTTITRADGTTLATAFDAVGSIITQTDALGHATTYGYDSLGRVVTATDALGRATTYSYDADGNRTSLTDPLNQTTSYGYDQAGQLLGITYSLTTTPTVSFSYTLTGRRQRMTDGTGTTSYQYDQLDRPITVTTGTGQAVGDGYDLVGNLTTQTYPDGSQVTRTFDPDNRLTAVGDWRGHTTRFGYDAASNLTTQTYPNTTTARFGYDAADRLAGITDTTSITTLWSFGYGRDPLGQLSSNADPLDGQQHAYGYDPLNRLTSDGRAAGTTAWAYNAAQDLTAITDTARGTTSALAYDNADQLTALRTTTGITQTGNLSVMYDSNGNRTSQQDSVSGASARYGYDQADRLVTATVGSTQASYGYNGDGLRQAKTVNGAATAQTWDTAGAGGLPTLLQDGSVRYIYGPAGLPLEQIDGSGAVLYYYHDVQGSTRGLLDGSGTTVATASYDPYGRPTARTGGVTPPVGYAGQYTDTETGFQYLRARYYDPTTAQFLTRDPLQGLTKQPYAYAAGSPLNLGDPSGLSPCDSGSSVLTLFIACPLYHGLSQGSTGLRVTGPASGAIAAGLDALHAARSGPLGAALHAANALNNDPGFRAATLPIAAPVGDFVGRTVERIAPFVPLAAPEDGLLASAARLGEGDFARAGVAALAHDAVRVTTRDVAESCVKCFPAGTLVSTPHGTVAIDTLHVGDAVLSEDPKAGTVESEPVQRVIKDPASPLIAVNLSDGSAITVTADHPFWLDSGASLSGPGWLQAGQLRAGDHLRTASGRDALVVGLRRDVGQAVVYTLTVAHDHTYFVGTDQVLVHNCVDVPHATGQTSIDLSSDWRDNLPTINVGDKFVYALWDSEAGVPLKVGKTSGPLSTLIKSRLEPYARAGRNLDLNLEMQMWRVAPPSGTTAQAIEKQVRNTLTDTGHDLLWDNSGERLGRTGPGVPFVTSSLTRRNAWGWEGNLDNSNYGRLVDRSGNLVPQDLPYYP